MKIIHIQFLRNPPNRGSKGHISIYSQTAGDTRKVSLCRRYLYSDWGSGVAVAEEWLVKGIDFVRLSTELETGERAPPGTHCWHYCKLLILRWTLLRFFCTWLKIYEWDSSCQFHICPTVAFCLVVDLEPVALHECVAYTQLCARCMLSRQQHLWRRDPLGIGKSHGIQREMFVYSDETHTSGCHQQLSDCSRVDAETHFDGQRTRRLWIPRVVSWQPYLALKKTVKVVP